jgi:hypothetical protein
LVMRNMSEQKLLPFTRKREPERRQLVWLNAADAAERKRCVDNDVEFPPSMLENTRCQRMGVSRGFFAGMFLSDRNREIADEECILRGSGWQFEECTRVDWLAADREGKFVASVFQSQLVALVESRIRQTEPKPERAKRKHVN